MAIIPINNEEVEMTPRNPVAVRGSAAAGVAEEGLVDLGQSLQRTGGTILEHYKRQQEMADQNSLDESKNVLENGYKTAYAKAQDAAKPDGSDLYQKFQENLPDQLDGLSDVRPKTQPYQDKLDSIHNNFKRLFQRQSFIDSAK